MFALGSWMKNALHRPGLDVSTSVLLAKTGKDWVRYQVLWLLIHPKEESVTKYPHIREEIQHGAYCPWEMRWPLDEWILLRGIFNIRCILQAYLTANSARGFLFLHGHPDRHRLRAGYPSWVVENEQRSSEFGSIHMFIVGTSTGLIRI